MKYGKGTRELWDVRSGGDLEISAVDGNTRKKLWRSKLISRSTDRRRVGMQNDAET